MRAREQQGAEQAARPSGQIPSPRAYANGHAHSIVLAAMLIASACCRCAEHTGGQGRLWPGHDPPGVLAGLRG